jgi:hypothetical protein
MSILAQIGYGKGERIHKGLSEGLLAGMVLSPRDESPENLIAFGNGIRDAYPNALILFDPQFYATTIAEPRDKHLPEYPYHGGLASLGRTHFRPAQIANYAKACISYQHNALPFLSHVISPTIRLQDFGDSWSQIALGLAEEAAANAPTPADKGMLISIVADESAFRDTSALDEYLDALTQLEVAGFYLLVHRGTGAGPSLDTKTIENLLYTIHVLAGINQYRVVAGYTDWHGFLLEAENRANRYSLPPLGTG